MKDIEMVNHKLLNQILEYKNLVRTLEFERSRYTMNRGSITYEAGGEFMKLIISSEHTR